MQRILIQLKRIIAGAAAIVALCAMGGFLSGCSLVSTASPGPPPFIMYRLTLADLHLKVVHVEACVYGLAGDALVLRAPANETGGSFEPINISARDARGAALAVQRRDEGWRIESAGDDFSFAYDVLLAIDDPHSPDVRSMLTLLADDRCRILGRDVLLLPEASFADGVIVDADLFPAEGLSSSAPAIRTRIIVPGVDELARTMVAAGAYRFHERRIGSTVLSLAIADGWTFGDVEFFDLLCRLVAEEISLLGPPPQPRYLFVCDHNPVRGCARFDHYGVHYGGSMLLLFDPRVGRGTPMDAPMAVIAHEFFHNWNGEALAGADESFLWFTEGATVYCSYRILERTNVLTPRQIDSHRRSVRERYRANPHLDRISIAEAVTRGMSDKDVVNLLYDGGYLAAEALDERIRLETDAEAGLLDVIRYLHERAGRSELTGERALVAAVIDFGGGDLSRYLDELVRTPASRVISDRFTALE